MNELQKVVNAVLVQQKLLLAPSTYDVRRCYLEQLSDHAEKTGFTEPCQELYDSYVSRADTPDLRFQLFHTVRLVDKEAGTRAFMPAPWYRVPLRCDYRCYIIIKPGREGKVVDCELP